MHPLGIVVSAVRSPNVPRVSKSYESFGNRFTTTIVDDLATSDLSYAVKGVCASLVYFQGLDIFQVLMPSSMLHLRSRVAPSRELFSRFVLALPVSMFLGSVTL